MSGVRFTQRWIWEDQSRTPLGPLAKVLLLQGSLPFECRCKEGYTSDENHCEGIFLSFYWLVVNREVERINYKICSFLSYIFISFLY